MVADTEKNDLLPIKLFTSIATHRKAVKPTNPEDKMDSRPWCLDSEGEIAARDLCMYINMVRANLRSKQQQENSE